MPHDLMETTIEVRVVPMRKGTRRWMNLRKPQERRYLGKDDTQRFNQRSIVARSAWRPSLPLASLPNRWGRIHWLGNCGDLWYGRCPRCWCVYYLIRGRPNRQLNWHERGVDVGNSRFRRVLLLRMVAGATAAVVAAGAADRCLLGKCRECREVATP